MVERASFVPDPRDPTSGRNIPLLDTAATAALSNFGLPFGSVLARIGGIKVSMFSSTL